MITVHVVLDQFDGNKPKKRVIYFLESEKRLRVLEELILKKIWQELEYVVYLLKEIDSTIARSVEFLKKIILEKQRGLCKKSTYPYVPKYVLEDEISC